MSNRFFISDHHLTHKSFLNFKDDNGTHIRPFSSVEEMDEHMIMEHNKVVSKHDKVYFGGDVSYSQKGLKLLDRMNGTKILIRGNHDSHKIKIQEYLKYFKDILGVKTFNDDGFIVSHYPISEHSLWQHRKQRPIINVHGHTHNNILPSLYYINMCVEPLNYTPISYDDLLIRVKLQREELLNAV